jgi:hypothetical protein
LLAASVALATTGAAGAAPVPGTAGRPVFRFADSRIDEASGIGVGIASPGVVYVQNDSGDAARFFAVDASTGATLAVYSVPGAQNVDWEDLAVARDARGVPSVWLADIGDNGAARQEVRIYRVDEPVVDRARAGLQLATAEPSVWRLRYPDGPADAEALAVAPGGAGYVVTKSFFGESAVYAVPATADPTRVQTLRRVAEIRFSMTGTPGGPSAIGQLTATGAAMSADGHVLAVRTYSDAYLWPGVAWRHRGDGFMARRCASRCPSSGWARAWPCRARRFWWTQKVSGRRCTRCRCLLCRLGPAPRHRRRPPANRTQSERTRPARPPNGRQRRGRPGGFGSAWVPSCLLVPGSPSRFVGGAGDLDL